MGLIEPAELVADDTGSELVDLEVYGVDLGAASILPDVVARRCRALPVGRRFGTPVIALSESTDLLALDDLKVVIGREFVAMRTSDEQFEVFFSRLYGNGSSDARPETANPGAVAQGGEDGHERGGVRVAEEQSAASREEIFQRRLKEALASAQSASTDSEVAPLQDEAVDREPRVAEEENSGLVEERSVTDGLAVSQRTLREALASAQSAPSAGDVSTEQEIARALPVSPVRVDVEEQSSNLGISREAEGQSTVSAPSTTEHPDSSRNGSKAVGPSEAPVANADDRISPNGTMATGDGLAPGDDLDASRAADGQAGSDDVDGAVDSEDPIFGEPTVKERDLSAAGDEGPEGADGEAALAAVNEQDIFGFPPLARVLVEGERVSLDEMRDVVAEHDHTGLPVAQILTSRNLVTEADLMWGLAEEMGLEFVDLDLYGVDFEAALRLPEATARHHHLLLVGEHEGRPIIAASNPTDVFAMDDVRTILGSNFVTTVATRSQIATYIDRTYHSGGDATEVASTAAAASDYSAHADEDLSNIQAVVDDAPIVRYVNLLILQALNERASDIHVEPTADSLRIRYRIDGVLHDMSSGPRSIAAGVITRLKVMADMNIAEHRLPQDGRISLTVGDRPIDLRIATLPTIYGEKIVMRIIDKSNVVLGFEDLGFDDLLLERYQSVFTKPYGTILVTGPTGSGKTTTLYATLSALNNPEKNIITVEDPVELRIKGINQIQLNTKAGLTFASVLRSILRADPDIVLVGEIRDRDTAMISIEAALTGHLVLATLHTNDSASTPMRLIEMGVEPYLVTSAAGGVLAQRLARRLCVHCKEPYEATEAEVVATGWSAEEVFGKVEQPTLYQAIGCAGCSRTGYRGRKALLELLVVTEEIERMISDGSTADAIHRVAVEQGMVPLRQSGLRRALEGETTLEEVLRVVA